MGKYLSELRAFAAWFERQKRILPWRSDPSVYRVWISEIMLQQTQVATVIPYFERFVARFPDINSLASADEADVMLHWAGLGYYSRARNLQKTARIIAESGRFPESREEWLEMPGVGAYTAGAVLSIAQDRPEALLDGNVERVLSRVRRVGRERGDTVYKAKLWRISRAVVRSAWRSGIRPSVINQALMELGALICTPKNPACSRCPVAGICRARAAGEQESYPPKKKPKQWIELREEVHCVFSSDGRVLVRQRKPGEWRSGLWDFPERLEALVSGAQLVSLGEVESRHVVTRHRIERKTRVWRLRSWSASEPRETDLRWVDPREPGVALGSAIRQSLKKVFERFPGASRGS